MIVRIVRQHDPRVRTIAAMEHRNAHLSQNSQESIERRNVGWIGDTWKSDVSQVASDTSDIRSDVERLRALSEASSVIAKRSFVISIVALIFS